MSHLQPINNKYIFDTLIKVQNGGFLQPIRKPEFRVSSLPYCPLLHALDKVKYDDKIKKDVFEEVKHTDAFYFDQGHALHSLWQRSSAYSVPTELIGDWQCNHLLCEKTKDNKVIQERCNRHLTFRSAKEMQTATCPHGKKDCTASQIYSELEFEWFGLTAHSDGLFREKISKKKYNFHLVDWKTTSLFLFDNQKRAISMGYYPSKKYLEQLESYCVLLEVKYKIKISTYTIAYISRDRSEHKKGKPALKLFSYKFTDAIRATRLKKMEMHRSRYRVFLRTMKNPTKKTIKKLYESRPCHTQAKYANNMAFKFFDKCEFAGGNPHISCLNGTMLKYLNKKLLK